jgi:hypothetical protein
MLLVAKQSRYLRRFSAAGAATPSRAAALRDLRLRDSRSFQRLVRRGLFVETVPGKYYLKLDLAAKFKRQRRNQAFLVLAIALIVAGVLSAIALYRTSPSRSAWSGHPWTSLPSTSWTPQVV